VVKDQHPGNAVTLFNERSLREEHRCSQTGAQMRGNPSQKRDLAGAKVGPAALAPQVDSPPQFPVRGKDAAQLIVLSCRAAHLPVPEGALEPAPGGLGEQGERLDSEGKILGGGHPVGERAVAFIVEADSNDELDVLLHELPAWGVLKTGVTPLRRFEEWLETERQFTERFESTLAQQR